MPASSSWTRTGWRWPIRSPRARWPVPSPPAPRSRPTPSKGPWPAARGRSDTLDTTLLYVAVPAASGGAVHGAVRLSYPTSEVDERVRETWLTLGAVALVSLTAAVVIGAVLARSVARPLRRLQRAATRLGGGDLTARAPGDAGPPEVRSLATAFNDTADRLEALVKAQDEFVADASHQLRTPLAALRLRLENLEPAVPEPDREDVECRARRGGRACRGSSTACWPWPAPTAGAPRRPLRRSRFGRCSTSGTSVWAPVAAEQTVGIEVSCPDDLEVVATPDRLSQVLDNLLANAIEVSPAGARSTSRAVPSGDRAVLHLIDEGPGMAPEQRERAFDRFWRGETVGRGSGLGSGHRAEAGAGGRRRGEPARGADRRPRRQDPPPTGAVLSPED